MRYAMIQLRKMASEKLLLTINFVQVEYIWKSHWSMGKCLYIASRYLAFVDAFLHLRSKFVLSLLYNKLKTAP